MVRSLERIALALLLALLLGGCQVGRYVIYNFADTNDHRKFPARALPASEDPWEYPVASEEIMPRSVLVQGRERPFDEFLERHKTVAFLVIRRDTIVYERYFKGYDPARMHTSFSMAKSVIGILIGVAVDDGFIKGVHQPVTDFLPELEENGFGQVTLEHLLQMTSGLKFKESYTNPFGDAASFYYGRRMYHRMAKMKLEAPPGERFSYQSGSSQLLGWVLERALHQAGDQRTITQYAHEKLWEPLGMVYDGSWSTDRKKGGIEKTFCCLNARARDYAKFGSLYLHGGAWQGKQLVPAEWVQQSTRMDTTQGSVPHYQYQWWLPTAQGDFLARGILGQYVYVNPAEEMVIVRLGTKTGRVDWDGLFPSMVGIWR